METLPSLVVMGLVVVETLLSVDIVGSVVDTVSSVVLLSVVDSAVGVDVIISVVVERPGRRAHCEA